MISKNFAKNENIGKIQKWDKNIEKEYSQKLKENIQIPKNNFTIELKDKTKTIGVGIVEINFGEIILKNTYILKKEETIFKKLLEFLNYNFLTVKIENPKEKTIKLLLKYGYARKLNEDIIISPISFKINPEDLKNYTGDINHILNITYIYSQEKKTPIITDELSKDEINQIYAIKELKEEYLKKTKKEIKKNHEKIKEILINIMRKIPKKEYTIEEIMGKNPQDEGYLNILKNDGLINNLDNIMIDEDIRDAYKNREINNASIIIRIYYHILDYLDLAEKIENPYTKIKETYTCPKCKNIIDKTKTSCLYCGELIK